MRGPGKCSPRRTRPPSAPRVGLECEWDDWRDAWDDPDDGLLPPGTENFQHRPALRANRAFVLKCVRAKSRNWHALKHASKALKRDRAVVLAAVRTSGAALMHAPKKFCGDKEIVMAALSSPLAQPYVSKKLARDKEVAFRARQPAGLPA